MVSTLIVPQLQSGPDSGQGMNPISRLAQIQQAKKDKEPEYVLLAERGLPRRREFVMQVGWPGSGVLPSQPEAGQGQARPQQAEPSASPRPHMLLRCCLRHNLMPERVLHGTRAAVSAGRRLFLLLSLRGLYCLINCVKDLFLLLLILP